MIDSEKLRITFKLVTICAPQKRPGIYQHSIAYMIDLARDRTTSRQLRELKRLRRTTLRALKQMLTRFPVKEVKRPTVYFIAEAGRPPGRPLSEFRFAIERAREPSGHVVQWCARADEFQIQQEFCPDADAVIRCADKIIEAFAAAWLLTDILEKRPPTRAEFDPAAFFGKSSAW